jgi:hypothetical protein
MPARLKFNQLAQVGDFVTCLGNVVSVTPVSSNPSLALVTIQPVSNNAGTVPPTFIAQANDSAAVETDNGAPCLSKFGKAYGYVGDQTSTSGVITAISGSGAAATLTITLQNSGLSVVVPANSCIGADTVGGS